MSYGGGIALGSFSESKASIEHDLNELYNWRGHNDEINWLSDNFGYILTNKYQLTKGIENSFMAAAFREAIFMPRGSERKKFFEDYRKKSKESAAEFVESIPIEIFLNQTNQKVYEYPNI